MYTYFNFSRQYSCNENLVGLRQTFPTSTTTLSNVIQKLRVGHRLFKKLYNVRKRRR